jgi:hypothetical protein
MVQLLDCWPRGKWSSLISLAFLRACEHVLSGLILYLAPSVIPAQSDDDRMLLQLCMLLLESPAALW